jgi:hypothetical protein
LDWIVKQSENTILFYDNAQSVKPSDIGKEVFDKLKSNKSTKIEYLNSQLRVKGGNAYVQNINQLLRCTIDSDKRSNPKIMCSCFLILWRPRTRNKIKNEGYGLSRLIAGYS